MRLGALSLDAPRRTALPVVLGAVAMLTVLIGPAWLPAVAAFAAAYVAGALNSEQPVRAGLLTVALPIVGAVTRFLLDAPSAFGLLIYCTLGAAGFALIASHLGAGVARRRAAPRPRDEIGPQSATEL